MATHVRSPSPDATTTTPPSGAGSTSHETVPRAKRVRLDESIPSTPVASTSKLPYEKGLHLAPMVRIGTLPTRLLALEYGVELVWGPEIVDKAIIGAERVVDPVSGTIKFIKNNRSIFECHPIEKPRLIFQLGSADPKLAVEAAKVIANDVSGVGLNCGCPKHFSIQAGMGAALLHMPDKLCSILTSLVSSIPLPIDVKIRLFPTPEPTISLVQKLLDTGVSCLTVHCRTQDMRSSEPALHDRLSELVQLGRHKGIPVVANGDCWLEKDAQGILEMTGVTSVMVARGAEANPSCFRKGGPLDPASEVIPRLLRISIASNNHFQNTKYIINAMSFTTSPTPPSKEVKGALKQKCNRAKTYEEMAEIFGMTKEDVEEARGTSLESLVPGWMERRRKILEVDEPGEARLEEKMPTELVQEDVRKVDEVALASA